MATQQLKPVVRATDMDKEEIDKVLQLVTEGLKEGLKEARQERVLCRYIKMQMDKAWESGWNCVLGKNFGAHVIHQTKKYIFLQARQLSIVVWKA